MYKTAERLYNEARPQNTTSSGKATKELRSALRRVERRKARTGEAAVLRKALKILEDPRATPIQASLDGIEYFTVKELAGALEPRIAAVRPQLSEADKLAIAYYTTPSASEHDPQRPKHDFLNYALRQGKISEIELIAQKSHDISAVLSTLPRYSGELWRGVYIDDDLVQKRYQPGQTVLENQYSSASFDPNEKFRGNVMFAYLAKDASVVHTLSETSSECEVLFDRFTKFYIHDRYFDAGLKTWVIVAEQVE